MGRVKYQLELKILEGLKTMVDINLDHFTEAQNSNLEIALTELTAGKTFR